MRWAEYSALALLCHASYRRPAALWRAKPGNHECFGPATERVTRSMSSVGFADASLVFVIDGRRWCHRSPASSREWTRAAMFWCSGRTCRRASIARRADGTGLVACAHPSRPVGQCDRWQPHHETGETRHRRPAHERLPRAPSAYRFQWIRTIAAQNAPGRNFRPTGLTATSAKNSAIMSSAAAKKPGMSSTVPCTGAASP